MNLLKDRLDRLPVLLPFPLLYRPDQKILRRVLHIDKLQEPVDLAELIVLRVDDRPVLKEIHAEPTLYRLLMEEK